MNGKEISFSPQTKSISLVKLSSEALQCIEEYVREGVSAGFKPTIQFSGRQGVLNIPGMDSTESFSFSLSDVEEIGLLTGLQSDFQCIEKFENGEMMSLGSIKTKLQIHAKNTSFAHTKSQIEAVEEKQKKSGAKIIKSACSSQDNSSRVSQNSQVEASAPRERKKAVPLLKKLLSRNFLKGLRSGNTSGTRTVPNLTVQRSAVLLSDPPPISPKKERRIVEMKKKRMLEDSSTESYSDPRRKKHRIAHCNQTELSSFEKVDGNSSSVASCISKSETLAMAKVNKIQSQEVMKRKKRKPTPAEKTSQSQTRITHVPIITKSEKTALVPANSSQCQEAEIKKKTYNSTSGVQTTSYRNSDTVASKSVYKNKSQEERHLMRKLKNRIRRQRQKQRKRAERCRKAAEKREKAAQKKLLVSHAPPFLENQSSRNTQSEIPVIDPTTQEPKKHCNSIEQPLCKVEIQKFIELKLQSENFTLDITEPCTKQIKITQEDQNELLLVDKVDEEFSSRNLDDTLTKSNSNMQDLNFTQKALKWKKFTETDNIKVARHNQKALLLLDKVEGVSISKFPVTSTKSNDRNLQSHNFTEVKSGNNGFQKVDILKITPDNQKDFPMVSKVEEANIINISNLAVTPIKSSDRNLQNPNCTKLEKKNNGLQKVDNLKMTQDNQKDLPLVVKVDEEFSKLAVSLTKSKDRKLQNPDSAQIESKNDGFEKDNLFKASNNLLKCLESSALDILPTKSTESDVPLPDLVQHCERVLATDNNDIEDITRSLADEQVEIHSQVQGTETNPLLSPTTKIPEICKPQSEDFTTYNSRNQSSVLPSYNNGCEVTSTTKKVLTVMQEKPIASSSNGNKSSAMISSIPHETAISDDRKFKEITTLEQRRVYKTLFTEKFEMYKELQNDLSIYDKYLQSLECATRSHEKGSHDYNLVKNKLHKSLMFHKTRMKQFTALHVQLEHIRELVLKFDSKLENEA